MILNLKIFCWCQIVNRIWINEVILNALFDNNDGYTFLAHKFFILFILFQGYFTHWYCHLLNTFYTVNAIESQKLLSLLTKGGDQLFNISSKLESVTKYKCSTIQTEQNTIKRNKIQQQKIPKYKHDKIQKNKIQIAKIQM